MKTTRQSTELAKTVAEGDIREDSAVKQLFQINEIAAWSEVVRGGVLSTAHTGHRQLMNRGSRQRPEQKTV